MGGSHRKLLPLPGPPAAATSSREPAATAPRTTLLGTYVYCVVRGATATAPAVAVREARLPGAERPRVEPLGARTWLVIAEVPLTIYGEKALEGRLKDLDWVAAIGVAHQAMVDACLRHDAVVPMKVFTIFTSLDRAREEMRRHADRLRSAMQQVAGCVEWGVRITRAPQPARTLARTQERPVARAQVGPAVDDRASGRAFLESKVRQRHAVREETEALDRHVRTLTDTLHDVTRDVRYRLDAAQGTVPVLLDAAYLVPRRSEKRFREQVRSMARPLLACGCRVTVTGPWPAYSFVSPAGR